jgi:hypothetical protein
MLVRDQFPAGGIQGWRSGWSSRPGRSETDGSAGARSTLAASRSLESNPKGGMEAVEVPKVSHAQQVSAPSNST